MAPVVVTRELGVAPHLRPFVIGYRPYDMTGWPPGVHRGLPDGCINMMISLGGLCSIARSGQAPVRGSVVSGLLLGPVAVVHEGTQTGVEVTLTPSGSRAILGMPASQLSDEIWPLDAVIGARANELVERLSPCGSATEIRLSLDDALTTWLTDARIPVIPDAAWRIMRSSAGSCPVSRLASEVGIGRRQLSALVGAELGLSPKELARVFRFAAAGRRLRSGRASSLAATAASCGYYDQSHFTNDWKTFAGCTPSQWVAEELPFLQDN
ncbi:MAG: helix-turn-helix domain-containing protein [Acidimicrobiales bacterium]